MNASGFTFERALPIAFGSVASPSKNCRHKRCNDGNEATCQKAIRIECAIRMKRKRGWSRVSASIPRMEKTPGFQNTSRFSASPEVLVSEFTSFRLATRSRGVMQTIFFHRGKPLFRPCPPAGDTEPCAPRSGDNEEGGASALRAQAARKKASSSMPVEFVPLNSPATNKVPPKGLGPPPAMVPRRFAAPFVLLRLRAEPLLGSCAFEGSLLKLPEGSDGTSGGARGVLGMAAGTADDPSWPCCEVRLSPDSTRWLLRRSILSRPSSPAPHLHTPRQQPTIQWRPWRGTAATPLLLL